MSVNLIDMAKSYLTPIVIEKLGSTVGLSPEQTQSSLKAILPTTMAGLVQNASSESGSKHLSDMLGQKNFDGSMLGDLSNRLGGDTGEQVVQSGKGMLASLFGGKLDAIEHLLTQFTGSDKGSISTLLAASVPFVMNLLGKVKHEQGLGAGGLRELLLSQKDTIAKLAPPGLANVLGVSSLGDLGGVAEAGKEKIASYAGQAREQTPAAYPSAPRGGPEKRHAGVRWLPIAVACLAVLAALWFLRERPRHMATRETPSPTAENRPAIRGEPVSNLVTITLPNGMSVKAEANSIAIKMADFLRNPAGKPSEQFALSDMSFEGSEPTSAATPQLDQIAQVLKAYPDARARIESYGPAGEEAAAARQLGTDRANRIKAILVTHGVPAERIETEGKQAEADTPEKTEITIERGSH